MSSESNLTSRFQKGQKKSPEEIKKREKILLELAQAENPTQALNAHYEGCSIRERSVLDGIVRELKECGYINVQWADDMPGLNRSRLEDLICAWFLKVKSQQRKESEKE